MNNRKIEHAEGIQNAVYSIKENKKGGGIYAELLIGLITENTLGRKVL